VNLTDCSSAAPVSSLVMTTAVVATCIRNRINRKEFGACTRVIHGRFLHFEADPHESEVGLRIGSHVDRVRPCHGPGSPLKTTRFCLKTTPSSLRERGRRPANGPEREKCSVAIDNKQSSLGDERFRRIPCYPYPGCLSHPFRVRELKSMAQGTVKWFNGR